MNLRSVALLTLAASTAALLLALTACALALWVMRQNGETLTTVRDLERRAERRHHDHGPPPGTPERRHPHHPHTRHTPAHYQRPAVPPTDRERTTP